MKQFKIEVHAFQIFGVKLHKNPTVESWQKHELMMKCSHKDEGGDGA